MGLQKAMHKCGRILGTGVRTLSSCFSVLLRSPDLSQVSRSRVPFLSLQILSRHVSTRLSVVPGRSTRRRTGTAGNRWSKPPTMTSWDFVSQEESPLCSTVSESTRRTTASSTAPTLRRTRGIQKAQSRTGAM
ncbi:hypothetical protein M378DRAFT_997673 [Amanita muscaria Koide BX008]|uniref:Uncharacterized protein n=1 Tax=Amanita muscaria (strain Koide BX008) TaxID=946122 RepID=A0A0C2SA76_AMAMK|nr:hypothetical protein M378DRAFT_997673 [Amanita muscaria Koide BX008]